MEDFNEFDLELAIEMRDHSATVHLAGELDFFTVEQLRVAVHHALENQPSELVLDLSDLTFIDLRGVGTLTELAQESRRHGIRVELSHSNPAVERLAALLQVDQESLLGQVGGG